MVATRVSCPTGVCARPRGPAGYRLDHRARQIRGYDLDDFDIVIGMDDNNMYDLDRLADTQERQTVWCA